MSYVIKAVLSNPQRPECGQVTIPFPIPVDQYDQTIDMLQAMELGRPVNRDCKVDEINSHYSVLGALKDTPVNVDQLDYLAKRLDSFCVGEDSQFQAMAHKLEMTDMIRVDEDMGEEREYHEFPIDFLMEKTKHLEGRFSRSGPVAISRQDIYELLGDYSPEPPEQGMTMKGMM